MLSITALAVWLGYNINLIQQRQAFLSDQLARHVATEYTLTFPDNHTERRRIDQQRATEWWHKQLATGQTAAWPLNLFGEAGVGNLWVVVPASDTADRDWQQAKYGLFHGKAIWKEISSLQPDYRRAKRLFPEANVRPVAPDDVIRERNGGGYSGWNHPGVTVRNPSRPSTLRVICDEKVVENRVLNGRFVLNAPLEGVAIIYWHTHDVTATSWSDKNYEETGDMILAEPGQQEFAFTINIGALTAEQRAAGGATFKMDLRTVVGTVPEAKEKTITIVPAN